MSKTVVLKATAALVAAGFLCSCEVLTLPFAKEFKNAVDPVVVQEKIGAMSLPEAPTGLKATANDGVVVLSWDEVSTADSYQVFWAEGKSAKTTDRVVDANKIVDRVATIESLTNGTKYAFVVVAHNAKGDSQASAAVTATPQVGPPDTPVSVTVLGADRSVHISWTSTAGATGYNVLRASGTSAAAQLNFSALTATETTDTTVSNGTVYRYQIVAINAGGESAPSPEVSVTPNPPIPGTPTLQSAVAGNAKVTLSWGSVSGATSYNIYRSSSAQQPGSLINPSAVTTTSYLDAAAQNGVIYYYTVAAKNSGGESPASAPLGAVPLQDRGKLQVAYEADWLGSLRVSTVDLVSGALNEFETPSVGGGPAYVKTTPNKKFVYVASSDGQIAGFSIASETGATTSLGSPFDSHSSTANPYTLLIESTSQFLYSVNRGGSSDSSITAFRIESNGELTFVESYVTGGWSSAAVIDPLGKHLYFYDYGNRVLCKFTINATTGALNTPSQLDMSEKHWEGTGLTIDPEGKFLYLAFPSNNCIGAFSIDVSTGELLELAQSPFSTGAGTNPADVTLDTTGRYLYTANQGNSTVSAFSVDQATGILTELSGSPYQDDVGNLDDMTNTITVDPTSSYLYCANSNGHSYSAFSLDILTGHLSPLSGSPLGAGNLGPKDFDLISLP